MAAKVHPHLKSFIRSVVASEVLGSSKKPGNNKWQEHLMRDVQSNILDRLGEIGSQADLERVTLEEVRKLQGDFSLTLERIGRTLQQLPIELLKER